MKGLAFTSQPWKGRKERSGEEGKKVSQGAGSAGKKMEGKRKDF